MTDAAQHQTLPAFFLLTITPVIIVGFLFFQNTCSTIQANTVNHLVATNLLKKAEFERWVRDNVRTLEILVKSPFFADDLPVLIDIHGKAPFSAASHHRVASQLSPVLGGGGFRELFLLRATDGLVLISTDPVQEGKYLDNQPYFIQGQSDTHIQNVYYDMSLQQAAMTIGTPLRDAGGATIAVLAGRVDLSQLSSIMERRSGRSLSEDTYLVNKFNFCVTEPRFGSGYALKKSVHTKGVQAALSKMEGVDLYPDYRGIPVIGAYQWLPEWELGLITEVDQAEAYAPVIALRNTVLWIAAVIALAAAGLGRLIAAKVTKPLRRLVEVTENIDPHNLNVTLGANGPDEVGDLARAFDRMIKRLSSTLVSRDALLAEIAERKRVEELRERALAELQRSNQELQQFAYVASHDLQEPLRMVSSYTQLLADRYRGRLDDRAEKYIHYAVDGAKRMQGLIQDLLSYSRVTTQGGPIEPVDSQGALDSALANLQASITESGAIVSKDRLPAVAADPTQLAQLFQNLIANAVKFRRKTPPRVHISADKNGKYWRFGVADNGIGIDEQYRDRIFVIFQRLHTRSEYQGSGIGLAICKRIVERHGGRIWFDSKPGKGTTFYFTLKKGTTSS